jgi:protein SHQ1
MDHQDQTAYDHLLKFHPVAHSLLKEKQAAKAKLDVDNVAPEVEITEAVAATPEKSSENQWTQGELEQLKNLPHKEYVIEPHDLRTIYLGLVDILLAYAYDCRTTEGEHTIESAWTVAKLSTTLSCLAPPATLSACLRSCLRRMVTYPLYRSRALFEKVLKDVKVILTLGKQAILRCLLDLKRFMEASETGYIFDRVAVCDYCVWIQGADDNVIKALAKEVRKVEAGDIDSGFGLEEIEKRAELEPLEVDEQKDVPRSIIEPESELGTIYRDNPTEAAQQPSIAELRADAKKKRVLIEEIGQ